MRSKSRMPKMPEEVKQYGDAEFKKQVRELKKLRAQLNKKMPKRLGRGQTLDKLIKKDKNELKIKKYLKEANRKIDIFASLREDRLKKIRRNAKKLGYRFSTKGLALTTGRQMSKMVNDAMKQLFREAMYGDIDRQIALIDSQLDALIDYEGIKIEEMARKDYFEDIGKEAEEIYVRVRETLKEAENDSDDFIAKKAKILYKYTYKIFDEPGTWMRYAIRLKERLPEVDSVLDKYLYDSGSKQIYRTGTDRDNLYDESRFECWDKIINAFFEDFNDERFRIWLSAATDKMMAVPVDFRMKGLDLSGLE